MNLAEKTPAAAATTTKKPRKLRKLLLSFGGGAISGGLGAMALLTFADSGMVGDLGHSREIAALVGLVYFVTAIAVGLGTASPRFGALYLNVEDPDELREQKASLLASSLAMAAIGLAMAVLAFAAPAGIVPTEIALALTLILFAATWILSVRQMKHVDELVKEVSREAAAVAFYLAILFGGGWAILAHLEYFPPPAPLDWLTLLAALLLIGTFAACAKKGLLTMR